MFCVKAITGLRIGTKLSKKVYPLIPPRGNGQLHKEENKWKGGSALISLI
jgi:hypothetical protein